jgi:hypothetical protein
MARDKRKKRKRHSASNYMPSIQPNPNLDKDKINHLPRIISDCDADLSQKDIDEIKLRLNFSDHNDLIKLHCIRIVNQASIQLPSKESTSGCYYPENGSKKAEIWISSDLIKRGKGIEGFFNKLAYKDKLFDTLFHELGHHRSKLSHSVDKYENEAYAEKYMLTYRKCWRSHFGPSKIYITIFRFFIRILRYIIIGMLFPFRNKNKEINLFYRNIKGEITYKEFTKEYNELNGLNDNTNGKRKKKWIHPLNKEKYRERFNLPDR